VKAKGSSDSYPHINRRAALKCLVLGGAALMSGAFPTMPRLESLEKLYGSVPSQYTANDAYQIITQALATGQTKIHLPAGNYQISQQITIIIPNIEIYGDGQNATILTWTNPTPANAFSFSSTATGFYLHDLQINGNAPSVGVTVDSDGNAYVAGVKAATYANHGVILNNVSNGKVENCTISNCRFYGVDIQLGSNCIIQNNIILNSGANGITIGNHNGVTGVATGSGHQILNNTVNGASDVGISCWEAIGTVIQGNTVENITLQVSPYNVNSHIGIDAEGSKPNSDITISNNVIQNIVATTGDAGQAFWLHSDGSSNIQFTNNTIKNVDTFGILGSDVTGLEITGNTINGVTGSHPVLTINAPTGTFPTGAIIEQNTFEGIPSGMTAPIINLRAGSGNFTGNTIYANGNSNVIAVDSSATWVTTPNTVTQQSNAPVPEFSSTAVEVFSALAASLYVLHRRHK